MPRSAAARDADSQSRPIPRAPADGAGRHGREAEETNPCGQARHSSISWRSRARKQVEALSSPPPPPSFPRRPIPTHSRSDGKRKRGGHGRSLAVDRIRMRWTSPVDNTAPFPLFYFSGELIDGFVYLLPRASPVRPPFLSACLPSATFIALELPLLHSLTHAFVVQQPATVVS